MTKDIVERIRNGEVPGLVINPNNPAMAYTEMDIHSAAGTKVRFTGHGGYESDKARANKYLTVGEFYTVASINIGSMSSAVEFAEHPGLWFNTVMFEEALPQHGAANKAKPEPIDMADKTLSQVLELLGWSHTSATAKRSGRRVLDDQGRDQGVLDYQECVAKLRSKGLIR